MDAKLWLVVRRSRTIPGGYRVVRARLGQEQAKRIATSYKRPHQAMSRDELVKLRLAALAALTQG